MFFFVLAGLLVLPLVEPVLPTDTEVKSAKSIMRRRSFLVPVGALAMTLTFGTIGLGVDGCDPNHPRRSRRHLMYAVDATTAALPCGPAMIKNLTLGRRRTFRTATVTPNRLSHFLTAQRRGGKAPPLRCPSSRLGSIFWNPIARVTAPASRYGSHPREGLM